MNSTSTTVSLAAPASVESHVSLARLYVLRAMYLVLAIGGGIAFLPQLIGHEPTARGVIPSMLAGMWLLACFGLRYPLQMLPILLFELAWKTIWLVDYGLPQWMAGVNTPVFKEDFKMIALGPVIFTLVIPWGYVYRHYLKNPGTRWRQAR
ncbi:MAG TPA: hypothetical protein VG456_10315 [Candidatus Sulfopaludibacter sp.]|jgi:hypothetical protein|nr:hypothetical protein [Candidatus Sulfopaludibacter sp.]